MELDQVDLVDTHPLERAFELCPGRVALALAGLGRQIKAVAVFGEERLEPILGRAVSGSRVDVVDAGGVDGARVASARS